MNLGLDGKVAIITGARQNIGKAVDLELLEIGALVVEVTRKVGNLTWIQEDINTHGQFLGKEADVITSDGVNLLVYWMTQTLQSRAYASGGNAAGYINCMTLPALKSVAQEYFQSALIFSMNNDEAVPTACHPIAQYVFAPCAGRE